MPRWLRHRFTVVPIVMTAVLAACSSSSSTSSSPGGTASGGACTPAETPIINFAAYSTPREVYGKIIPAFVSQWKEDHDDQNVIFQLSFGGSTTQAQNVVNGLEADVVALSLAPDVRLIQDAGLITHDWTKDTNNGIVASSAVVFDVRPGNPKHIESWDDLTQPGLEILTPDPAQSGGGALMDMGCHMIEAFRYFLGKDDRPVECIAWGERDAGSDLYNLPYDLGASFQTYMMHNIMGTPAPCYVSMYAEDRAARVPAPDKTIFRRTWRHGRWVASFFRNAKRELHRVQGLGDLWFAGNNTTIDSEEGALLSGMIIAEHAAGYRYPFPRGSFAWVMHGYFHEQMFPASSMRERVRRLWTGLG